MIRLLVPLAILMSSAGISLLMLRYPWGGSSDVTPPTSVASQLEQAVALKANHVSEAFPAATHPILESPTFDPVPPSVALPTAEPIELTQRIQSVPLSQVHDVFFAKGDVFSGRSASPTSAAPRNQAPRIQSNPFAR
ncbi:hypothetical protein Poly24_30890 [Rosistilla carotiformis]|uniref:Uncharacterized protein n=1 Tax=Rosistilla carotiformis TaxID=2528017 RepID=A0A518JUZ9_9BACT|nr:hypothetical protein [Rosistilla carotiformis]QDV69374.1 hypothetical protein Poly24_30890 [Rosistilla carotiformis]